MFKQKTHISHYTFKFLCERLRSYLQMINTHMGEAISIGSRVAMSLQRFETQVTLCNVGEVYGVDENLILEIVRNFVQFPSPTQCRVLAQDFEAFHGIPHII